MHHETDFIVPVILAVRDIVAHKKQFIEDVYPVNFHAIIGYLEYNNKVDFLDAEDLKPLPSSPMNPVGIDLFVT